MSIEKKKKEKPPLRCSGLYYVRVDLEIVSLV